MPQDIVDKGPGTSNLFGTPEENKENPKKAMQTYKYMTYDSKMTTITSPPPLVQILKKKRSSFPTIGSF